MPNFIRNKLTFEKSSDVDKILELTKTDYGKFDFNKLIPMPKDLNIDCSSKMKISYSIILYENEKIIDNILMLKYDNNDYDNIDKYIDHLKSIGMFDIELGKIAYQNKKKYGYTDWYDWCNDNWNTKWNAKEIFITDDYIIFETAWDAPFPVINKLQEMFPDINFTHKWADEDKGCNDGVVYYHNGVHTTLQYENDSIDAIKLYNELW